MLICRGDTHPNLGLFDEFEATWCIRPLFRSGEAVEPAPEGPVPRLLHYEKADGYTTWPQIRQKALDLDVYPPDISASIW